MKIPKKLKILGHWFRVQLVETEIIPGLGGDFQGRYNLIRIAQNQAESQRAEVFLHEIMELISVSLELGIEHPQISALSEGLFQVLRDNCLDFSDKSGEE